MAPPQAPTTASPSPCFFLELPPELRNHIYELVYNDIPQHDREVLIIKNYSSLSQTKPLFTIPRLSRQIRNDVLKMFFEPLLIDLSIESPEDLRLSKTFLSNVTDAVLATVRRFDIDGGAVTHEESCALHPAARADRFRVRRPFGRARQVPGLDGLTFDVSIEFLDGEVEIEMETGSCECQAVDRLVARMEALKREWSEGAGAGVKRAWLLKALSEVGDPVD